MPIVQVTIPSFHGQFAITQTIHYCIHDDGHWGSFGHVSFLPFFLFGGQCFDVQLCAPPGTAQLRALGLGLATLARIAN
jgi:hypothetical protein